MSHCRLSGIVRGLLLGISFLYFFFHLWSISSPSSLSCTVCACLLGSYIDRCCLDKGGHPFLFGPPSSRYTSAVVLASYLLYTYFGPPSSSLLLECRATSWGCPYSRKGSPNRGLRVWPHPVECEWESLHRDYGSPHLPSSSCRCTLAFCLALVVVHDVVIK